MARTVLTECVGLKPDRRESVVDLAERDSRNQVEAVHQMTLVVKVITERGQN